MNATVITIDGPAGAGKSTISKDLANRLGFEILETGAMYRAVALAAMQDSIPDDSISAWLETRQIEASPSLFRINGRSYADLVRNSEVSRASSRIAAIPAVRNILVRYQRQAVVGRSVVSEGRDQGTIVFPESPCKFFLTASREERAKRRLAQYIKDGKEMSLEQVLRDQDERDSRDEQRSCGPLTPAADAIVIDSTDLTREQVLARMVAEVSRCLSLPPGSFMNSATGSSHSSSQ